MLKNFNNSQQIIDQRNCEYFKDNALFIFIKDH